MVTPVLRFPREACAILLESIWEYSGKLLGSHQMGIGRFASFHATSCWTCALTSSPRSAHFTPLVTRALFAPSNEWLWPIFVHKDSPYYPLLKLSSTTQGCVPFLHLKKDIKLIGIRNFTNSRVTNKVSLNPLSPPIVTEPEDAITECTKGAGAFNSAKNHKRQSHKRQSVTAKREKSQTPKFV